jgi:hypothetical protein
VATNFLHLFCSWVALKISKPDLKSSSMLFFQAFVIFSLGVWAFSSMARPQRNLTVLVLLPYQTGNFFDLQMVAPALDIALEELHHTSPEIDIQIHYVKVFGLNDCTDVENVALDSMSRIYYERRDGPRPVSALMGPGCGNAVGQVASLARGTGGLNF